MSEWLASAGSSTAGIIIIIAAVIIFLKFFKKIAKPIVTLIIAVAAVLIFFNILDLALLAAGGEKLLSMLWSCTCGGSQVVSQSDALTACLL